MLTFWIFLTLLVLILIDLPIAVAMGLTAVIFFFITGNGSILVIMMSQRMYASTDWIYITCDTLFSYLPAI